MVIGMLLLISSFLSSILHNNLKVFVLSSRNLRGSFIISGNDIVDQILTVLLSTSMFVGGTIGFVLDNTIPG